MKLVLLNVFFLYLHVYKIKGINALTFLLWIISILYVSKELVNLGTLHIAVFICWGNNQCKNTCWKCLNIHSCIYKYARNVYIYKIVYCIQNRETRISLMVHMHLCNLSKYRVGHFQRFKKQKHKGCIKKSN